MVRERGASDSLPGVVPSLGEATDGGSGMMCKSVRRWSRKLEIERLSFTLNPLLVMRMGA